MSADELLNVVDAASYSGFVPGRCGTGFPTARSRSSSTATDSYASGAAYLTDSWRAVPSRRDRAMETTERRNRDFSKGPAWDPTTSRWLVEIRYPDGSRFRKRLRREREALRLWAAEQAKIENGTWDERAARNVTVAAALEAISRVLEGSAPVARQATSTRRSRFGKRISARRRRSRRSARSRSRTSS